MSGCPTIYSVYPRGGSELFFARLGRVVGWGKNVYVTLGTMWNGGHFSGFDVGMSVLKKVQTNVERFCLESFTDDSNVEL